MSRGAWDLFVVGGGTAGLLGAKTAARLGARVALAERGRLGGDCLWTGCVPSKSLIAAAGAADVGRESAGLGVRAGNVLVDYAQVRRHVRGAVAAIEPEDSAESLRDAGITVLTHSARFVGPRTIEVQGRPYAFEHALLAAGGEPVLPPVAGLDGVEPLTSETVWDLTELPRRLAVLGGGPLGCEFAQAFARLGVQVTVVEAGPRILSREHPDAAELVHASMQSDGVELLVDHRVLEVRGSADGGGSLVLDGPPGRATADFDRLLVATGRRPHTQDLGLCAAHVDLDASGQVRVSDHLQTSNPRIWAAGDVTGPPEFTHLAGAHASIAASNAVLGLRRRIRPETYPRVTFTDPEVAHVGEQSWADSGAPPRTVTRRHASVDRAITEGRTDGFATLVLDGRHRVTGATLVGPRAGECLAVMSVAVTHGLKTRDLAAATHAYPTYADASWNAAIDDLQAQLRRPAARVVTGVLRRVRRVRDRLHEQED